NIDLHGNPPWQPASQANSGRKKGRWKHRSPFGRAGSAKIRAAPIRLIHSFGCLEVVNRREGPAMAEETFAARQLRFISPPKSKPVVERTKLSADCDGVGILVLSTADAHGIHPGKINYPRPFVGHHVGVNFHDWTEPLVDEIV